MLSRITIAVMFALSLAVASFSFFPASHASAQSRSTSAEHVDAAAKLPPCSAAAVTYGRLVERRTIVEGKTREIYEYKGKRCARIVTDTPTTSPRRAPGRTR